MKNIVGNTQELLNNISGFHQYILSGSAHLSFVSRNFCDMVGFEKEELLHDSEDRYIQLVHPADRESYSLFIKSLSCKEQTADLQYRLVRKDGSIIHVNDTVTSELFDGVMIGNSVLSDITQLKSENNELRFLNETIPCGFLKYTCEKQPKVTYINDRMLKMLRFPKAKEGEIDYLEMYKGNIYLMIPMEERRRFSLFLNRVYTQGIPIAGEMAVLRCDGTKAHFFGWVTKCTNEHGLDEFQSVCIDVTEKYRLKKEIEAKRYLKALTDVYDKIFEYDLSNSTVKCLFGQRSSVLKWIENIPMQMNEATEKWIMSTVIEEDKAKVQRFFEDFLRRKTPESDSQPLQITYRAMSSSGTVKTYAGIFLKIDETVSLFCCRSVPDVDEAELLRSENLSLKNINENMQELVMRFADGIAAFEVNDEYVTPLYASDNVCKFFGFTKDEWLAMMKKSTPIKTFVARSGVAYEDFVEFLNNGEAEFTYYDFDLQSECRKKAICSSKSPQENSPRYVMLYNVDESVNTGVSQQHDRGAVSIRTFGYFDVFVGDKAIAFRSQKSKELFALLVDRRGGFVSSEEAISFLWEDEPVNAVTLSRYRKVALRLKNILEEYGIADVVESVDGKRRIVTERVQCDLYDYLSGKEEYSQLFKGNYLTNYSWGENTLGELMGEHVF